MKQSAKLCKMQNYNKYKIMQGANYAKLCINMQIHDIVKL